MGTLFEVGGPERFHHQKRGLHLLIKTGGVGALLFDPGLGKTAVVLDYAGLLALKAPSGEVRVLITCPLAAVDTWVLQAEKFGSPMVDWWAEALGGGLLQRAEALASRGGNSYRKALTRTRDKPGAPRARHHHLSWAWWARSAREREVTPSEGPGWSYPPGQPARPRVVLEVVNLDTFASRAQHGSGTMADLMLDAVKRFAPDLIVVDESHRIKGAGSHTSKLLGRIGKHAKRRVILTGTVMPHSPLDVFGQWRFLEPYAFGDLQHDGSRRIATVGGFRSRYAILGGWMGKQVTGFRNLDEMQKIMARNAVVARKADALDLPPTTEVIVPVDLSPAEKRVYGEMKDQLAAQLDTGAFATSGNQLTQMLRLRQITSGHLPDDNGSTAVIGQSKVNVIRSLVHDTLAGETRVVVFALFTVEIAMLAQALAEKGTEVMVIQGGTSTADRAQMRKRFGSDDPQRIVLIAQIKTMSLAVNELVTASHAIFASMSQQRDDFIQAQARLDRQGQTKPVTFWLALAPNTIDEVIYRTHQQRGDLETAMLAHVKGGQ